MMQKETVIRNGYYNACKNGRLEAVKYLLTLRDIMSIPDQQVSNNTYDIIGYSS